MQERHGDTPVWEHFLLAGMKGIEAILQRLGVPAIVQGPPSMFGVVFSDKEAIWDYRDWAYSDHDTYEEVILKLFDRGVMPDKDCREPWFISASHSDADADTVLNAFEESVKEVLG